MVGILTLPSIPSPPHGIPPPLSAPRPLFPWHKGSGCPSSLPPHCTHFSLAPCGLVVPIACRLESPRVPPPQASPCPSAPWPTDSFASVGSSAARGDGEQAGLTTGLRRHRMARPTGWMVCPSRHPFPSASVFVVVLARYGGWLVSHLPRIYTLPRA